MSDKKELNIIKIEGVNIDLTPIAEGINANLNALPSGANKLLDTFFGKKRADTWRHQVLNDAQTFKDLQLVLSNQAIYEDGEIKHLTPIEMIRLNAIEEESRCLCKCFGYSLKSSLERTDKPSEEPINQTFFNRWRNEAQLIEEPEIQDIWGQILVSALYEPSDFSLKSLDILRYLTTEVSNMFSDLCQYVIDDMVVINIDSRQIEESKTDILEEYGLIRFNAGGFGGTNMFLLKLSNYQNTHGKIEIPYRDHFIQYNSIGEPATLSGYQLTAVGRDFYKIAIQNEQYRKKDNETRTREFINFLAGIHDFKMNMLVYLYKATDSQPEFIEEIRLQ